jgi:enoyl-CoA hydratase/carnithine racemase
MVASAPSATPEIKAQLNAHCHVAIDARGVATLTMCNAGPLIIFGTPVIDAVRSGLETLAKNDRIRVLIIRGDSERAFVGGADIKEMVNLNQASAEVMITRLRDCCEAVRLFPAPVIARIPGWVLGGGLEFAACCDFRIASDTSQYGMPEVRVGIPSVIHAALLPRLIGSSRTRRLLMTAENIDASTALDWGLVDVVTSVAKLDAEVEKLVSTLLACGHEALVAQKRLMHQWEELPLKDSIDATIKVFGKSFLTGEPQRLMREFVNRPRPAKK